MARREETSIIRAYEKLKESVHKGDKEETYLWAWILTKEDRDAQYKPGHRNRPKNQKEEGLKHI